MYIINVETWLSTKRLPKSPILSQLSDKNNYRPIALANIMSKLFELRLLNRYETFLYTESNQFGFKDGTTRPMYMRFYITPTQ